MLEQIRRPVSKEDAWTSQQRQIYGETVIALADARLEQFFDPRRMVQIINNADLVVQLAGLYQTLTDPDAQRAKSFARKTILWTVQDMNRKGISMRPEIESIARDNLGTERI